VVVFEPNILGVRAGPFESDPILAADPDCVAWGFMALQSMQAAPRRKVQVLDPSGSVEAIQRFSGLPRQLLGQFREPSIQEQLFRVSIGERSDHFAPSSRSPLLKAGPSTSM
jgi:hypothetical protein